MRRLVCLELPGAFYADLPDRLVDLIDKVVQHRRSRARDGVDQLAMITAADITKILCDFAEDPWSNETKKRWLFDALKVPAKSRRDDEYLPQLFETMVAFWVAYASGREGAPEKLSEDMARRSLGFGFVGCQDK